VAYFQLYVILLIGVVCLLNYTVLRYFYLTVSANEVIVNKLYNNQKENAGRESTEIFLLSVFTAWVSPCSVWSNNFLIKTKFLLVSSTLTLCVHTFNIAMLCIIVQINQLISFNNPPFFHCFNNTKYFNASKYRFFFSANSSQSLIEICQNTEECLPVIRICSENESPSDTFLNFCLPVGMSLLFLSCCASVCLQLLSSYHRMYLFSRQCKLTCPKMFYNFLNDIVFSDKIQNLTIKDHATEGIKRGKQYLKSVQKANQTISKAAKYSDSYLQMSDILNDCIKYGKTIYNVNSDKVWEVPPMHKAVNEKRYSAWCFLSMVGGEAGALNGQTSSTINSILEKDLQNCSKLTQWWIMKEEQKYGENALHEATMLGDTELMEILIANGYDVDRKDSTEKTPLHIAVEIGNRECFRLLIESQPYVNMLDYYNQTPLHIAVEKENIEFVRTLIDSSANVNVNNITRKTPLMIASEKENIEIVQILIESHANVNALSQSGETPLIIATEKANVEILAL